MEPRIPIDQGWLTGFCERWKIARFALFGSVLRADFRQDSDVDVLLVFKANHGWSLFDLVRIRDELSQRFGRKIDLVTQDGLQSSRNPFRRESILREARVIHAA